jgi:hypothetical protein
MLLAISFAITACEYVPACALLEDDSGQIRFEKLCRFVLGSEYSVHDLSRTEVSPTSGMPRFNMPFELGLFLGAKHFGGAKFRNRRVLVLASSRTQWLPSISDLAGADPFFHELDPDQAIRAVRDFLHVFPDGELLPGEAALVEEYRFFRHVLPGMAYSHRQTEDEALRLRNFLALTARYLRDGPKMRTGARSYLPGGEER